MTLGLAKRRQSVVAEQAQAQDFDRPRCPANGCPFRPVVDPGLTGRMRCSVHAYAEPEDWPRLTERAQANQWLATFIGDIQRMAYRSQRGAWVEYANEFWREADAHCMPCDAEKGNASAYQYRMFGELLWRCGVRKDRPGRWGNPNKDKPARSVGGLQFPDREAA